MIPYTQVMYSLFVFFVCMVFFPFIDLRAQGSVKEDKLSGYWKGYVIYYDEELAQYNSVSLEMKLNQIGDSVWGTSFDYLLDPQTYCIADVAGTIKEKQVSIQTLRIKAKKERGDLLHLPVVYDLLLTNNPKIMEGKMYLQGFVDTDTTNNAYPFTIHLSQYQDTYVENLKYQYILPKTKTKYSYTDIENRVNDVFNKIIQNSSKELPKAPLKAKLITAKTPTKPLKLVRKYIHKSKDTLHSEQNTALVKRPFSDSVEQLPIVADTVAHYTPKALPLSVDSSLVDVYSLHHLNSIRVEKIKKLLKDSPQIANIYKQRNVKKASTQQYTLEFVDTVVFFSLQNENEWEDTLTIFWNKELVEPFMLVGTKPVFFKIDFREENIIPILVSSASTKHKAVKMKMILEDKNQQSIYELHINQHKDQNTKITFYYNEENKTYVHSSP